MRNNTLKTDNIIKELYQSNLSAPVISRKLRLPLNQIYSSLKRNRVERRKASIQNKIRFENKKLSFNFKKDLKLVEQKLLIAALMLYYGEGAKTQNTVDFANSDPKTLALFMKFLRDICRVDESRLRLYLYCFEGQNLNNLIKFWTEKLKVSKSSFTKPYIRKDSRHLKRVMPYGVLHIRYSDKKLLQRILFLIDQVTNELS